MASATEQFGQSDVTKWGVVALACGAFAVIAANLTALLPPNAANWLHSSRVEGASVSQLRIEMSQLQQDTARLRLENATLSNRFALAAQDSNGFVQRIGALEVSIPTLLEAIPAGTEIDRAAITAAIAENTGLSFSADGGTVTVVQKAMPGVPVQPASDVPQPMPPIPVYGVALGPVLSDAQGLGAWNALINSVGPMLIDMEPRLSTMTEGDGKRLVAGPTKDLTEATDLCGRMEQLEISCLPVPFTGTPLLTN